MAAGWIYALTNTAFPHLVKIGKTTTSPGQRASELNATGVPDLFEVAFSALSPDVDRHEVEVHRALEHSRYRNDREFFAIEVEQAVNVIRLVCGASDAETVLALKVELDLVRDSVQKLATEVLALRPLVQQLDSERKISRSLAEQLEVERKRATHQRNVNDVHRKMLDELRGRESELVAQLNALNLEIVSGRELLAQTHVGGKGST